MAMGNMHRKIGKDCAWFQRYPGGQIDRQTNTQADRQMCLLQYFPNAPTGLE